MGIQNLLKFLKPLAQPAHISAFAGHTVGVDAMSWLHRGAIACAVELVKQEDTDKFLRFVIHMIMLFKYHRVEPLLVFDGAKIPAKAAEDEKRQQARLKASEEARQLLKQHEEARRANRKPPGDTRELLTKCAQGISISPEMAAAVSEDSDLLAHGCGQVLFKMDKEGNCERLVLPLKDSTSLAFTSSTSGPQSSSLSKDANAKKLGQLECLRDFDQKMFTAMCVLGGCDYTHDVHINGLGISTACRFVHKLGKLERVIQYLFKDEKWKKKLTQPQEAVLRGHKMAMIAFTHHRVFDTSTGLVVAASTLLSPRSTPQTSKASSLPSSLPSSLSPSLPSSLSSSLSSSSRASSLPPFAARHSSSVSSPRREGPSNSETGIAEETEKGEKENQQPGSDSASRKKREGEGESDDPAKETEKAGGRRGNAQEATGSSILEDVDLETDSDDEASLERIVGRCQENFRPYAEGVVNPRTHKARIAHLTRKEQILIEEYRARSLVRVHEGNILSAHARARQAHQPSSSCPVSSSSSSCSSSSFSSCSSSSSSPSSYFSAVSSTVSSSACPSPRRASREASSEAREKAREIHAERMQAHAFDEFAMSGERSRQTMQRHEGGAPPPLSSGASEAVEREKKESDGGKDAAGRPPTRDTLHAESGREKETKYERQDVEEAKSRVVLAKEKTAKGGQMKLSFIAVKRTRVVHVKRDVTESLPGSRHLPNRKNIHSESCASPPSSEVPARTLAGSRSASFAAFAYCEEEQLGNQGRENEKGESSGGEEGDSGGGATGDRGDRTQKRERQEDDAEDARGKRRKSTQTRFPSDASNASFASSSQPLPLASSPSPSSSFAAPAPPAPSPSPLSSLSQPSQLPSQSSMSSDSFSQTSFLSSQPSSQPSVPRFFASSSSHRPPAGALPLAGKKKKFGAGFDAAPSASGPPRGSWILGGKETPSLPGASLSSFSWRNKK
ncbi:T10O22.7, related [Neospora caninum Liverpool]|uniref:Exonuclease 1 n=1 Tax=Neospora caninum (strain Liverpool) TaxID=572307 RepID=F0VIE1_NEOCL|nr:T10O22.7, related [Neospora caninum Liverpool]CBZ53502.1 T10O22.7, related [Neospora caninum Liverpool]|eukprot:XP_003883534.1 T10O22.7, related [Neospora caninum Liverpool]